MWRASLRKPRTPPARRANRHDDVPLQHDEAKKGQGDRGDRSRASIGALRSGAIFTDILDFAREFSPFKAAQAIDEQRV